MRKSPRTDREQNKRIRSGGDRGTPTVGHSPDSGGDCLAERPRVQSGEPTGTSVLDESGHADPDGEPMVVADDVSGE